MDLPPPDVCHCRSCRKQSGHCFASTDVPKTALTVTDSGSLAWYQSSERIRRGFCALRIDAVLGAVPSRLDRRRNGGVRRPDWHQRQKAYLCGAERRLLRDR
ncbi:GFA family protein [Sphingomonas sp. Leaf22]|uniref:GFA family protein n=1 Tax=Sphingomonas sp. Leaf22 TaxID=1735687 RepID=UPI001F44695E|nr:GFA family protein [Sphingomonas sp. Leaf22]